MATKRSSQHIQSRMYGSRDGTKYPYFSSKYNRKIKTLTKKHRMYIEFKIRKSTLLDLFGRAMPSLNELSNSQMADILSCYYGYLMDSPYYVLDSEIVNKNSMVEIRIAVEKEHYYKQAEKLEQVLNKVIDKKFKFRIPAMFDTTSPSDIFDISKLRNYRGIFEWLLDNVTIYDYRIYSRFGNDTSIAFKNPEHAAMFKLKFG